MIIDVHTHILTLEPFEEVRKNHSIPVPHVFHERSGGLVYTFNSPDSLKRDYITEESYDVPKRIIDMHNDKVDMQLLSFFPYLTSRFLLNLNPELGLALAVAINDSMAKIVKEHPEEFNSLVTLPLQDVDASIEELDRATKDLGMKGVGIGSNVLGKNLDSFELWPLYEKVEQLDVPVLVHPSMPIGSERMRNYHLGNMIGNPAETSLAIASVIFGGVLERFPRLKFCFVHGGGFIPYQRGRLEHGYEVRPECRTEISRPPSEYLSKMYIDTITHSQPALYYLIQTMGSDRIVMGSDYDADMADFHPVKSIQDLELLSSDDKEKILGKNAAKLFKIPYK